MKEKLAFIVLLLLSTTIFVSAQEMRKYEIGADVSYGISLANGNSNHYGITLFGGYKLTDHIVCGVGVNYGNFQNRLLYSGIEGVLIQTERYHSIRPCFYGKYVFAPFKKWSPYVGVKVGYGAFLNSQISFGVPVGYNYMNINPDDYAYLKDYDHSLGISGNIYSSIDLGGSRRIGERGSRISFGVSIEVQPIQFQYIERIESRTAFTVGPYIGFSF